jgi:ornithine cyclodeaminase/alanine dehydrogenase-like protein (mu-crystallin family)
VLLLRNSDVAAVLSISEGISALRTGYSDLAQGDATYIPRIDMYAPTGRDDEYYQWGSMAGVSRSFGVAAVRIKSDVVSWPEGKTQDKYCIEPGVYSGIILLYSIVNGEPLALIQDGFLQHVRVGAAAGIGADALALPDADSLGLIGSGGMARTYLEAIANVRELRSVRVFSPTQANRERFAAAASDELGVQVTAVDSPETAISGAAIVATATDSMGPTFDPQWLSPGAHVTCVTRRELSDELVARVAGRAFQLGVHTVPYGAQVPDMEWKAGGIASFVSGRPEERSRIPTSQRRQTGAFPTLTDLQLGKVAGRLSATDITLFITTGTQGLQFAAVGGRVLQLARQNGLGAEFPTEWFLQDIRD